MTKYFYFNIINRLKVSADMAQMVERVLGKDEVTGSIPVISSKKRRQFRRLFLYNKGQIIKFYAETDVLFPFTFDFCNLLESSILTLSIDDFIL